MPIYIVREDWSAIGMGWSASQRKGGWLTKGWMGTPWTVMTTKVTAVLNNSSQQLIPKISIL